MGYGMIPRLYTAGVMKPRRTKEISPLTDYNTAKAEGEDQGGLSRKFGNKILLISVLRGRQRTQNTINWLTGQNDHEATKREGRVVGRH